MKMWKAGGECCRQNGPGSPGDMGIAWTGRGSTWLEGRAHGRECKMWPVEHAFPLQMLSRICSLN